MNLQQLIQKICISKESIMKVSKAKDVLINNIKSYSSDGDFPQLIETRIIGSYKRKTKINPLNDVDIVLTFGKGYYKGNNWHIIDDCSYSFSSIDYDDEQNVSSVRLLNKLKEKLSATYSRSEIRRNNEVVNVYLSSYDVGFDLIPAFYYRDVDYFLIPKGSNSTKWKKTNPIKDELILDEINNKNGNKIKDVIRIAKHFFSYKKIPSLRSYHLESCAYYIFNEISGNDSIREYLFYFYDNLDMELLNECEDPTGISEPLSSNLDMLDIKKITVALNETKSILSNSEEAYCEYVGF